MLLTIDTKAATLTVEEDSKRCEMPLYSKEAFRLINEQWVTVGWSQKYTYSFTWLGRPIIQLPEDLIRIQEVIYRLQPDVIVETGVAHGGSLIFYASLCKVLGRGRIVGVDVEIRPHNRKAIAEHPLTGLITLIEGDSKSPETIGRVQSLIRQEETVLVLLDSCHTREHVLAELRAYAPLVTPGSYAVATDGVMEWLASVPGGKPDWDWNNPKMAAQDYVSESPAFVLEEPPRLFDEGKIAERVTHWPGAFLKRVA